MAQLTEQEIIENAVRETLEKIAAEENKDTVQKPGPLSLNIGGQTHEFASKEELEASLNQVFSTFRTQLEAAKQPVVDTPKDGGYVKGTEAETFNQDTYVELMGKDVLKAQSYALDHVLGVPNAAQYLKQSAEESANLKATVAVYQFRELHPEFPMTPEATKIVDGLRRELNQPFTLQGLEAAYGVAQSRGLVPSPQVIAYQKYLADQGIQIPGQQVPQNQQVRQQPVQNHQGPLGFQPPPTVNRSAPAPGMDLAAQAENLTLEQLEKALRQAGQL